MAGSFSVTISNLSGLGGSKRAEAAEIQGMVERGLQVLVSSHATAVTLKDRNGTTAGTISWAPVNTA